LIFGVFRNISVIIPLHLKEEDFAFAIGASLNDVIINEIQNIITIIIELFFN